MLSEQILSRIKPAEDPKKNLVMTVRDKNLKKLNDIEDFISQRDYTGAIAFLQV